MVQTATSEEGPVATVETTLAPAEKADTTSSFLRVSTSIASSRVTACFVCVWHC